MIFYNKKTFSQAYVTADVSGVSSKFKFVNSLNQVDKNYSFLQSNGFSLGFMKVAKNNLLLRVNFGIRKSGSKLFIDNNSYSWNLNYYELRFGIGFVIDNYKIKPYFLASPYYAVLNSGFQTINSQAYDIKKISAIKNSDFGVFFGAGLKFKVLKSLDVFGEYNYQFGLQNNEVSKNQKSFIRANTLTFGLTLQISKNNPIG